MPRAPHIPTFFLHIEASLLLFKEVAYHFPVSPKLPFLRLFPILPLENFVIPTAGCICMALRRDGTWASDSGWKGLVEKQLDGFLKRGGLLGWGIFDEEREKG